MAGRTGTAWALLAAGLSACNGSAQAELAAECRAAVPETVLDGGSDGFHRLAGLAWGAGGRLFVLDGGDHRLVAYDSAGRELWRRGREGAGPAELRQPTGLAYSGGRLVTRDYGNHRLSFWTAAGEPAGTVPLAELGFTGYPGWVEALPGGRVVAMSMPPLRPGDRRALAGAVVVGTRGAHRVDTLAAFDFPAPQMMRSGGVQLPVMPPFAPYPQVAASADGSVYVSRAGGYEIERYDSAGRQVAVLRGPAGGPPLTPEDRERAASRLPQGVRVEDLELPGTLPPLAGLTATYEGDLFVRTNWRADGLVRWDRWTPDGRYRTSAMLPDDLRYVAVQGDRVAATRPDSLGVHSVAVFRLRGASQCAGPLPGSGG